MTFKITVLAVAALAARRRAGIVDDEAGWEVAANEIGTKIYNSDGIEIASYNSAGSFSSALMDRLNLQGRFAHGVESLNNFEVAEELVWALVPSGFIFGE